MQAYRVVSDQGFDAMERTELPDPTPEHGEVVVRVRAASLNYRDLVIAKGGYPRNDTRPVVPLSDAAGEVEAVGPGVDDWTAGDRVCPNFLPQWSTGAVTEAALRGALGGGVDGVLAERVKVPARSLVRVPEHLSFEEASTLPCAALTAWNGLTSAGVKAGDHVLLLGTGGVSIFALQLAKAMGARVTITSSSDDKLQKARSLGADDTINYKTSPEWHEEVLGLTAGRGVDAVLEVGGPGTLERSIQSTRVGGTVSLIGMLSEGAPSVLPVFLHAQRLLGIYVGSAEMFSAMNRAIEVSRIKPVIDRTFGFDEALEAYRYFAGQQHVGKVVITGVS